MSLRGAKRRGNPFSFLKIASSECEREYGLPPQSADWLAMICFLSQLKHNFTEPFLLRGPKDEDCPPVFVTHCQRSPTALFLIRFQQQHLDRQRGGAAGTVEGVVGNEGDFRMMNGQIVDIFLQYLQHPRLIALALH